MKIPSLLIAALVLVSPGRRAETVQPPQGPRHAPAPIAQQFPRYFLELAGAPAGFPNAVVGGRAVADIVVERSGTDNTVHKHLGAIKVESLILKVGLEMNPNFYSWISDLLASRQTAQGGKLVEVDRRRGPISLRSFDRALLTDVTFPACDAASKEASELTVSFTPESIRYSADASGASVPGFPTGPAKRLVTSHFKLSIAGVDGTPVRHLDSFVVHQNTTTFRDGGTGVTRTLPTSVDYGNLRVVVAESGAATWVAWMDATFQGGIPPQKEGMLDYLDTDLKTVLLRVKFHNLGLYSFAQSSSGGDDVEALEFGLFADSMEFEKP